MAAGENFGTVFTGTKRERMESMGEEWWRRMNFLRSASAGEEAGGGGRIFFSRRRWEKMQA